MTEVLLILFVLSACAGFVQRVSGFGFGIFIMMFLPYIMPSYKEAVALSGMLSATTALAILLRNFRYIRWRLMPVVLISNAAISYLVIQCMASMDGVLLQRLLGVALILVSLYFFFSEGEPKRFLRTVWLQGAVGIVSGVMGSMFGMPGPAVVLYGVSVIDNKREYLATMQAFWLLFNLVYMCFRADGGYYGSLTPLFWVVGLAGVLMGLLLGAKCFDAIKPKVFKKNVYLLMLLSGMVAFLK